MCVLLNWLIFPPEDFSASGRKRNEDQPDIYIYFWDKRDGPEFTGWWFGEAVGTSHVS